MISFVVIVSCGLCERRMQIPSLRYGMTRMQIPSLRYGMTRMQVASLRNDKNAGCYASLRNDKHDNKALANEDDGTVL
jgi:hypothetical protein